MIFHDQRIKIVWSCFVAEELWSLVFKGEIEETNRPLGITPKTLQSDFLVGSRRRLDYLFGLKGRAFLLHYRLATFLIAFEAGTRLPSLHLIELVLRLQHTLSQNV